MRCSTVKHPRRVLDIIDQADRGVYVVPLAIERPRHFDWKSVMAGLRSNGLRYLAMYYQPEQKQLTLALLGSRQEVHTRLINYLLSTDCARLEENAEVAFFPGNFDWDLGKVRDPVVLDILVFIQKEITSWMDITKVSRQTWHNLRQLNDRAPAMGVSIQR